MVKAKELKCEMKQHIKNYQINYERNARNIFAQSLKKKSNKGKIGRRHMI